MRNDNFNKIDGNNNNNNNNSSNNNYDNDGGLREKGKVRTRMERWMQGPRSLGMRSDNFNKINRNKNNNNKGGPRGTQNMETEEREDRSL